MENITILHGYINIYQLSNYGHVLFGKSCKHVYKGPGHLYLFFGIHDRRIRDKLSCGESGNGAIGVAIHGIPGDLGFSTMTQDPVGSPINFPTKTQDRRFPAGKMGLYPNMVGWL